MRPHPTALDRRRFLGSTFASLLFAGMVACARPQPPMRVASNAWLGYAPLFLARQLGLYDPARLLLVESPSNSTSLASLATGEVEAAALTLDEFLTGREGGLPIRVIMLFDESAGADVVMARPEIARLADLRGRRIGYEPTAVGAFMLAKTLEAAGLSPQEVHKVTIHADRHVAAYRAGEVEALVTFEPYASEVATLGGRRLLDSSRFPGLILDVLAARADALAQSPDAFRELVAGSFRALEHLHAQPAEAIGMLAASMGLAPQTVQAALKGIHFLGPAENHAWLKGPRLLDAARRLADVMHAHGLLQRIPPMHDLWDGRYLPPLAGSAQ